MSGTLSKIIILVEYVALPEQILVLYRLVFKCGSPHLNANANAQNDSNANANAQHLNQMQMQMQVRSI